MKKINKSIALIVFIFSGIMSVSTTADAGLFGRVFGRRHAMRHHCHVHCHAHKSPLTLKVERMLNSKAYNSSEKTKVKKLNTEISVLNNRINQLEKIFCCECKMHRRNRNHACCHHMAHVRNELHAKRQERNEKIIELNKLIK